MGRQSSCNLLLKSCGFPLYENLMGFFTYSRRAHKEIENYVKTEGRLFRSSWVESGGENSFTAKLSSSEQSKFSEFA
jgi:hypothetical protein